MLKDWFKRFREESPAEAAALTAEATPALPQIPQVLQPAQKACWMPVVEMNGDRAGASKFGGRPLVQTGRGRPLCGNCRKSLALLVQIASRDIPPEAGRPFGDGMLQVFYCLSQDPLCEVDAEAFFPFSTATLVRVLSPDVSTTASTDGEPPFYSGVITSWRQAEDYPNWDDQSTLGIVLPDAQVEDVGDTYPRPGDKLLGWPHWIQGLEYPNCRTCDTQMQYVFQIDSEDNVPYMFGDSGCGHVFRCGKHPDQLTFGWACL